jgi:hypothetical protein
MVSGVLVWIIVSLLIYALVVNGVWMIRHAQALDTSGFAGFERSRWAAAARAMYLLGIPILAMALRVPGLSAAALGLPPAGTLDQASDVLLLTLTLALATALVLAVVVGVVVAGSDLWFRWSQDRPAQLASRRLTPFSFGTLALGALCLEAHWAFFRAGPLALGLQNETLAVYLGLGILGLEAWVNPAARAARGDPEAMGGHARSAALAVLSMSVFLATGSSLACLAAHIATATGWALAGIPAVEAAAPPTPAGPGSLESIEPTVV